MVPTIERDGRHVWGWPEALAYYEQCSGIPVTFDRVAYYRRFYALPMFVFTHHAGYHVHQGGNRSARFAWTVDRDAAPGRAALRDRRRLRTGARPMMLPDVDDVLACLIDTIEAEITPHVDDDYAASLCLTVAQMLRSVRARVNHEGQALHEDNAELRELLGRLDADVDAATSEQIGEALAAATASGGYVAVDELQRHAMALRQALVVCIEALPDRDASARDAIRQYLAHQLERQRPWLIDAFTGPRR